jgi:hypothetical protein
VLERDVCLLYMYVYQPISAAAVAAAATVLTYHALHVLHSVCVCVIVSDHNCCYVDASTTKTVLQTILKYNN